MSLSFVINGTVRGGTVGNAGPTIGHLQQKFRF